MGFAAGMLATILGTVFVVRSQVNDAENKARAALTAEFEDKSEQATAEMQAKAQEAQAKAQEVFDKALAKAKTEAEAAGFAEGVRSVQFHNAYDEVVVRNGTDVALPAEYLLERNDAGREDALKTLGDAATIESDDPHNPDFRLSYGYDVRRERNGRIITFSDELVENDQYRAAFLRALRAVEERKLNPESAYNRHKANIQYKFFFAAHPPKESPKTLVVTENIAGAASYQLEEVSLSKE
jgi:LPS O-antigen subunit length determinant protein (WzzB/FepE family)